MFQNRTVNPNPDGWTTASETPTAFDFNRLPAELRVQIVKIHLSQPRIITLNIESRVWQRISKKCKRFGVDTYAIRSDLPPPALLYVSKEMQAEAKRILSKLNFDHIIRWSPLGRFETYTLPQPIYVNLEQDTLAFSEPRIAHKLSFENFGGVKSLGLWLNRQVAQNVLNPHDTYWNDRKLKDMLAVAPGIEKITFIVTKATEECTRGSPREIAEKKLVLIRKQVQAQNVTLPVRVQLERDYGTEIFYT